MEIGLYDCLLKPCVIYLFIFNLFPLLPLDGYRIVEDLVSPDTRIKMQQYEQYGVLIFVILWITPLGNYIFSPLFNQLVPAIYDFFSALLDYQYNT